MHWLEGLTCIRWMPVQALVRTPFKGSSCFPEQDSLPSLLSIVPYPLSTEYQLYRWTCADHFLLRRHKRPKQLTTIYLSKLTGVIYIEPISNWFNDIDIAFVIDAVWFLYHNSNE